MHAERLVHKLDTFTDQHRAAQQPGAGRGGRPPLGSAAASVESVRLDPELKRALLIRAAEEHVSVSEVIRRAIGEYLRAS